MILKYNKKAPFHFLFFLFIIVFHILYSFTIYTKADDESTVTHLSKSALEGQQIFQKNNCISCHQIFGLGGYMGPDLTNVISTTGKGDPFVKAILQVGTARMPNFHLPESEINALIEYLSYIDKCGKFPVRRKDIAFQWYGTVEIN